LDDLTPLQQLTAEIAASEAYLFDPKPAYRFQPTSSTMQFFPEPSFGHNPPYGASIHYWLKEKSDSVELVIKDKDGNTVKTLKEKGKPGINRVWWNLRGEPTEKIALRTKPLYADWYTMEKDGTRAAMVPPFSILVPPGTYTVEMTLGEENHSKELVVLKDPHSEGSLEDIQAQTEMMKQLYEDMNKLSGEINKIERIRRQLLDKKTILQTQKDKKEVLEAIDSMNDEFLAIEKKIIQLKITGTGQDNIRFPSMLASRIAYLASVVAVADFPPTDQAQEVHKILQQRLADYSSALDELLKGKFAAFLKLLSDHKVEIIVTD
jgi:hypothetical protein